MGNPAEVNDPPPESAETLPPPPKLSTGKIRNSWGALTHGKTLPKGERGLRSLTHNRPYRVLSFIKHPFELLFNLFF